MTPGPPELFRKRRFEANIIVTCVRWYFRFSLSLRDLEELMAERGLSVDHTTIWRWTQAYGPVAYQHLQGKRPRRARSGSPGHRDNRVRRYDQTDMPRPHLVFGLFLAAAAFCA